MKSRSLCAQRKKAQRLPLGHCLGTHTPGPRTSGENWMFFEADGCVAGDRELLPCSAAKPHNNGPYSRLRLS